MCPVTEAWTRHRGGMQEAAVTSGQKGQRDLSQWEEIGGLYGEPLGNLKWHRIFGEPKYKV